MKYATYLRVSTAKQGRSGLGLDAQRKMCSDFIAANNGKLTQEFVDVESGTHRNRKGLQDAIAYCKKNGCALVIAKLDRLARDVEFCFKVVNTGIEIHFTDMPTINTLLLGVFAAVAQYERELTSDRTKKALAVKKAQGAKLGAASDKYAEAMAAKSQAERQSEIASRSAKRRNHYQGARDVQTLIRIIMNVFPTATNNEEPSKWNWRLINVKKENRVKIISLMNDYKTLDPNGELFADWNFNDDDATYKKLASKMQALKKSFT